MKNEPQMSFLQWRRSRDEARVLGVTQGDTKVNLDTIFQEKSKSVSKMSQKNKKLQTFKNFLGIRSRPR